MFDTTILDGVAVLRLKSSNGPSWPCYDVGKINILDQRMRHMAKKVNVPLSG